VLLSNQPNEQPLIQVRATEAATALEDAAVLVDELASDIEARQADVERLIDQQEENARLADLSSEQIEAIVSALDAQSARSRNSDIGIAVVIAVASLILGWVLNAMFGPWVLRKWAHVRGKPAPEK
jgi:alkylation response protein AidB-like acyl-CoA dehydrogenase